GDVALHKLVKISSILTEVVRVSNFCQKTLRFFVILFVKCLRRQENCTLAVIAPYHVADQPEDINTNIIISVSHGVGKSYNRQGNNNHSEASIHPKSR